MKTRTKWIALCTLLAALLISLCAAGTMLAFAATDVPVTSQQDWTDVPSTWQFTDDGAVSTNTGFQQNYLLTQTDDMVGDYSVTATFTGTATTVTGEINMGIIPWYLDAQNYVLVYLQWKAEHATSLMDFQVLYFRNGAMSNWNDHWLDHNELYALTPENTITMTVKKEFVDGKDNFTVTISGTDDDGVLHEQTFLTEADKFDVFVPYAARKVKAGVYTCNDTVTVSKFETQSLSVAGDYKTVSGSDTTAKSATETGWSYSAEAYTVDASSGTAADNQAVYKNTNASGNYAVSYTANCTAPSGNVLSVLPYYADEDNFARFVIEQTASGADISIEGEQGGVAFNQDFTAYTGSINWSSAAIRATKVGTNVNLYIGDGEDPVATYTTGFTDRADVGFGAAGGSVTFSQVATSPEGYQSYDWFIDGAYYLSAETEDSIAIANGSVTMTVDPEEATHYTRFYTASGYYNRVGVSGAFTVTENSDNASYGLYLYYVSDTENVAVTMTANAVTLSAVSAANPQTWTYTFAEPLTLTESHTLAATATFGSVVVTVDGAEIVFADEEAAAVDVTMLAGLETCNVGMFAMGGSVTADFAVSGFAPYQAMTAGGWTTYGARLNSWTVSEDGKTLSNTVSGGTNFKSVSAIASSELAVPADGYYIATALQRTGVVDGSMEWKYGVIAYYDAGDSIYVWLSQWADGNTTITMTAALGGTVIGNEWRETTVLYNMTDINYLEVYVHGDTVDVYLNRQFTPVATATFEGLSEQPAASYGLNSYNTAVTFDEVQISTERVFKVEDNVIINIGSNFPTTGTVGKAVNLGVITAELENAGTSVTANITVTGPNDEPVTVSGVRFTPETAGEYTVTITATDAWGNTATEVKTITVTEAGTDQGTDPGTDTEEPGEGLGGGAIAGIVIGCVAAVAIVAVVIIVLKKKKSGSK